MKRFEENEKKMEDLKKQMQEKREEINDEIVPGAYFYDVKKVESLKAEINKMQEKYDELEAIPTKEKIEKERGILQKELDNVNEELKEYQQGGIYFETEEMKELQDRKKELKEEIAKKDEILNIINEIEKVETELDDLNEEKKEYIGAYFIPEEIVDAEKEKQEQLEQLYKKLDEYTKERIQDKNNKTKPINGKDDKGNSQAGKDDNDRGNNKGGKDDNDKGNNKGGKDDNDKGNNKGGKDDDDKGDNRGGKDDDDKGDNRGGKDDDDKEDPGDGKDDDDKEDPGDKKLVPLYWEVYNKVATEHCSGPARALYNLSKTTIFPWNLNMSTPEKLLSVVGTPFRALGKLVGTIGTKFTGADKKYEKMLEAVNDLTPEEFSVLTDTNSLAKERGFEKVNDDFEISKDMIRFKHNTLALDAICSRVETETRNVQAVAENEIKKTEKWIERALEEIKNGGLTPEEKENIEQQIKIAQTRTIPLLNERINAQINKRDSIIHAKEHRTSKYKDTEGWILGKFNPDNREANKMMEQLQKKYVQAIEKGASPAEIDKAKKEMEDFANSQTKTITIGENINNKISRGNYAYGKVKVLNMTPQTIGKQILANVMAGATIAHVFTNFKNQLRVDEAIQNNNDRIAEANALNKEIPFSGSKKVDFEEATNIDVEAAETGMKNVTEVATHGISERGNLDQYANEAGAGWQTGMNNPEFSVSDLKNHQDISAQVNDGNLESAINLYSEKLGQYVPEIEKYSKLHPEFNLDILKSMKTEGLKELEEMFKKLNTSVEVDYSGVVNGVTIDPMAGVQLQTADPFVVAAMLASQTGHLVSTRRKEEDKKNESNNKQKEEKNQSNHREGKAQSQVVLKNETLSENKAIRRDEAMATTVEKEDR